MGVRSLGSVPSLHFPSKKKTCQNLPPLQNKETFLGDLRDKFLSSLSARPPRQTNSPPPSTWGEGLEFGNWHLVHKKKSHPSILSSDPKIFNFFEKRKDDEDMMPSCSVPLSPGVLHSGFPKFKQQVNKIGMRINPSRSSLPPAERSRAGASPGRSLCPGLLGERGGGRSGTP